MDKRKKLISKIILAVYAIMIVLLILMPELLESFDEYSGFAFNVIMTCPLLLVMAFIDIRKYIFDILLYLMFIIIVVLYDSYLLAPLETYSKLANLYTFIGYIWLVYIAFRIRYNTKDKKHIVPIVMLSILVIILFFSSHYYDNLQFANNSSKTVSENFILEEEISDEQLNAIYNEYYSSDEIIISRGQEKGLVDSFNGYDQNFYYDEQLFTQDDLDKISEIDGVKSVEFRTNLHDLINEEMVVFTDDEQYDKTNEYKDAYEAVLEEMYPGENIKEVSPSYVGGIPMVDINNPNPLGANFGSYYLYNTSDIVINNGNMPAKDYEIIVPDILANIYLYKNSTQTMDDIIGMKIPNLYNGFDYTLVGTYDFKEHVGKNYTTNVYGLSDYNTLLPDVNSPIFVYYDDEYTQEEYDYIYSNLNKSNNLYYGDSIKLEGIKSNDYLQNNEIIITLESGDTQLQEDVLKDLEKDYKEYHIVALSKDKLNVHNTYDYKDSSMFRI